MFVVCITASAGLFAALILKKDRPEYAVFVIVLTSLLLALRIMGVLETVMGELQAVGYSSWGEKTVCKSIVKTHWDYLFM